jgi:predicted deacylase
MGGGSHGLLFLPVALGGDFNLPGLLQEQPILSFSESYRDARSKFLAAGFGVKASIYTYPCLELTGKLGETLSCDVAVLGPEDATHAAIVISGTHGAEGFCGSAILHRWLLSRSSTPPLRNVKVVLVHAVNPWAFSHITRTTENNVDLNRNFILNGNYSRQNPAYDQLMPFLHTNAFGAQESLEAYRGYKAFLDQHGWQIENEFYEGQSHSQMGSIIPAKHQNGGT